MPHAPTPWVGLAALVAMFVLPYLPTWLSEGPRTIRHRPLRHICGDCQAPWTSDHTCNPVIDAALPPLRVSFVGANRQPSLNAGRDPGSPRRPRPTGCRGPFGHCGCGPSASSPGQWPAAAGEAAR